MTGPVVGGYYVWDGSRMRTLTFLHTIDEGWAADRAVVGEPIDLPPTTNKENTP